MCTVVFALFCVVLIAILIVDGSWLLSILAPEDAVRVSGSPGVPQPVPFQEVDSCGNRFCRELHLREHPEDGRLRGVPQRRADHQQAEGWRLPRGERAFR